MTRKILLTGVTGTIGCYLVECLADRHGEVRVLARSEAKAQPFRGRGFEAFVGDFDQPETLSPALEGVEKLFLLSVADPRQVEMQGRVVEAARRAGVRHLVKLSASCAAPNLPTPIKRWHYETEQQIERSGIPYTFLRPNCFMQNMLKWARGIRERGFFRMPIGDARVSQVDARDIAAVAAAVLTEEGHEGRTYEITGHAALSFEEVAEHFSSVLGRIIGYRRASYDRCRRHMVETGMEEWLADAVTETYRFMARGGAEHVTDTVLRVTGREPISCRQFIRDHAEAFISSGSAVSAPMMEVCSP
jgi:uncharacterized protein YbjT (DUF2867 family)